MTRDTCLQETCSMCPVAVMEDPPKQDQTGSESFYDPLPSELKQQDESTTFIQSRAASLVPDIDRPQVPSPDIPMASKKLIKYRFEAENANRIAKTDSEAMSRPAIIQWAPSKGYQQSELHMHVKETTDHLNTTQLKSTAVTHSVPVHSSPVMSQWTKHIYTDKDLHINHAKRHENETDLPKGMKVHCKEGEPNRTVDITSARESQEAEHALDLSISRKTPSPTNSTLSRSSTPLSPTTMPLTPNSHTSFTEKFQALTTEEPVPQQTQLMYMDLNRLKEIYTHNINAMVKSQAHDSKWQDNIQNPNTTKIYPRAVLGNGVKAAPVTVNVQNTESGKMYQCQLCNVMFKHRHHVVRHMRSHTGEKPFQCQECGARFARKCILTNHMRVHTGEKPFICRECGDMFSRKHHLVIHVRTHTGEKPYCCGKCGAAFSRSHHLGRHMKTHEPKRGIDGAENTIEQYQCSKCPAKFAHPNSLSRHIKTHNFSKLDTSATVPAVFTSQATTNLTQINQPLNTFTYPFPTSFGFALPSRSTSAQDTVPRVKSEFPDSNNVAYKLDSIPIPRTDVVIPSSSGFRPLTSVSASLSSEHSKVIKQELSD
ncbi:uncharacterized protein [Antedon mediterranea]|uniref:uncharacterized protein n=1 Tax=Antedon mediterranea TaxID=105859 RepID=UPI003AF6ED11